MSLSNRNMAFIRRFFQWSIGIFCALFVCLQIVLQLPSVQEWAGRQTAGILHEEFGWDIKIGSVKYRLGNRIIVDDILLKDEQDSTMLNASRVAAKFEILPLFQKKIRIANAQLFGTQIQLYQTTEDSKPNFQFVVDAFSRNDTTSNPIDLKIGSVLLRRVNVQWDQQWKARKDSSLLDFAHIKLNNISVTAHLKSLKQDSVNVSLKRFSFEEESGFAFQDLNFDFCANETSAQLRNFILEFSNSKLEIPHIVATWPEGMLQEDKSTWVSQLSWNGETKVHITPSDFKHFLPQLKHAHLPIDVEANVFGIEDCLNVHRFNVSNQSNFLLECKAFVRNLSNNPDYAIDIQNIQTDASIQQFITNSLEGSEREISPLITRMDSVRMQGRLDLSKQKQSAKINIFNHIANICASVEATDWNNFKATLTSDDVKLNKLLADDGVHAMESVSLDAKASGCIKDAEGRPNILAQITLPNLNISGRTYNDISISSEFINGKLGVVAEAEDEEGTLLARATWDRERNNSLTADIDVKNLLAERLGLGEKYPNTRFSAITNVRAEGSSVDDVIAQLDICDFLMTNASGDTIIAGPWDFSVNTDIDRSKWRTLDITSQQLNAYAQGRYRFSTLAATIQNTLHRRLPNLVPYKSVTSRADTMQFAISFQDTTLLRRVALQKVSIPSLATIEGKFYGHDSLNVKANIPTIYIGKEHLRNTNISVKGTPKEFLTNINTDRKHKRGFVNYSLRTDAHDDRLAIILALDNMRKPHTKGHMEVIANFSRNSVGKRNIFAWIAPTDFIVSDTTWRIHPATIELNDKVTNVQGFKVTTQLPNSALRSIEINGNVSPDETDTLFVALNDINIGYILDLVNFKSVEFDGYATGEAVATSILNSPQANIDLTINNFLFNHAPMGTLYAKANWGNEPNKLALDATISDPSSGHESKINGGFQIGKKGEPDGLDLKINTTRFNIAFINFFTEDIFDDFQGRATGNCRIYGPFKKIDLEGDLIVEHASLGMPMLGTRYHISQDSVHIRPGEFSIKALLFDKYSSVKSLPFANRSVTRNNNVPHTAVLNGSLKHNHFKNLSYNFKARANNFLGYDFKEFREESFYATCFASGDISIDGSSGQLSVDINAQPESGTTFTYNVSTPEAITEAEFLTIKDAAERDSVSIVLSDKKKVEQADDIESDLFINFNLMVTPKASMKLLMDKKSGDMIELMGSGRINAKYHNKGNFDIIGTYRVDGGSYKLSIQDIIRRDFIFQPDGTITFGGDPMKANIDMKAVYVVNSVSLDDLTTSSLGFSKTQVNCIMNLTGHPEQPQVTFDFDLPYASEDEKQMVRSIVSTEEERNIQAVYLLGLGRFFNFDSEEGFESSRAMNSIVSSTLSQQLNQFLTSAVGSNKWNVGTSLKTGDDGWRNMDVEGLLSGKLFDDRLLVNGNFGYREKYYTQRSFISDVSVEYLLTKNGTISLKAYNQANDRYFVQSSLNTQGVGVQFKKDFNKAIDLFQWIFPRKFKSNEEEDDNEAE